MSGPKRGIQTPEAEREPIAARRTNQLYSSDAGSRPAESSPSLSRFVLSVQNCTPLAHLFASDLTSPHLKYYRKKLPEAGTVEGLLLADSVEKVGHGFHGRKNSRLRLNLCVEERILG